MSENGGPWQRPPERPRGGFPLGVVLWLVFAFALAIGIWLLADLFPGRLSSQESGADLVRLIALLALVSSGLLFARRINLGEAARNLAIWIGAAAILVLIYTYQDELLSIGKRISGELLPSEPVTTQAGEVTLTQGRGGHFHATGLANGIRVAFLVDTGATDVVLSPADARRIGIDLATLQYTRFYRTANGQGRGAPYRLDRLSIGGIEFRDFGVSINEAEMSASLLGMTFLNRLNSFEVQGRKMILRP